MLLLRKLKCYANGDKQSVGAGMTDVRVAIMQMRSCSWKRDVRRHELPSGPHFTSRSQTNSIMQIRWPSEAG